MKTEAEKLVSIACEFAEIVSQGDLHGLAFQHLSLCARRAWFHMNRIDYAHLDRRMQLGLALHDQSRPRDKSVEGMFGLSPDVVDWRRCVILEEKSSAGAKEAVSRQAAFYALMMTACTGKVWSVEISVIGSKKRRKVEIDSAYAARMVGEAKRLCELGGYSRPPLFERVPVCPKCSYRFLCGAA